MTRVFAAIALAALLGCNPPEAPEAAPAQAEAPAVQPDDLRRFFPADGRTNMELVNDNLLGKDYLPGGNLATYEKDGKSYQMFLLATPSPDDAALLSFELKGQLENPKLVPTFGGYFGMEGETPWFVFPKAKYFAGVVGLPQDEADLAARDFAARIPAQ